MALGNATTIKGPEVPSDSFSSRHGFHVSNPPITIWEDAPEDFRHAVLMIAKSEGAIEPYDLREIVCSVLRKRPDPNNWSPYPNVWGEVEWLVENSHWYRVYDIVEAIYRHLSSPTACSIDKQSPKQREFEIQISKVMAEFGIGWKLDNGLVVARGEDSYEAYLKFSEENLTQTEKPTAITELREAIRDLSRRPSPDTSGAIQHGMAALECVVRDAAGDSKPTLGQLIKKHPELFPKPIDSAVEKLWGYASENARHGKEGNDPTREEAMLVVGISATLVNYLIHKSGVAGQ
ncbi:AbiJ-NTD4 domain-containing protein [Planctomicrobium sp. SH668]|uniref:AbiJ-NTD4 domain-containing protein n=1 Tax=Planctomicrobium sp. SH668 TaxID=3448126 RepID=UPI003F5C589B